MANYIEGIYDFGAMLQWGPYKYSNNRASAEIL
jgi:hypothetical protein